MKSVFFLRDLPTEVPHRISQLLEVDEPPGCSSSAELVEGKVLSLLTASNAGIDALSSCMEVIDPGTGSLVVGKVSCYIFGLSHCFGLFCTMTTMLILTVILTVRQVSLGTDTPLCQQKSAILCSFLSFSITPRNEILVPEDDSLGSLLQVSESKILKKLLLVEKRPK